MCCFGVLVGFQAELSGSRLSAPPSRHEIWVGNTVLGVFSRVGCLIQRGKGDEIP